MNGLYVRMGFCMDYGSIGHRVINRVTGGPGHVFVEFLEKENGDNDRFTFDSTIQKDPRTKKNGVRGPLPISVWEDWYEEDPYNRHLYFIPVQYYLPLTQEEAYQALHRLTHAAHAIKYARLQLPQNWVANRTGIQMSWRQGSPSRWTCSETPVRAVIPPRYWHLIGPEHPSLQCQGGMLDNRADFIVPGGKSFMSLERGLLRIIDQFGVEDPQS